MDTVTVPAMATPTLPGLPPEVRNRIYGLVLIKVEPIVVQDPAVRREEKDVLSLLHVCRQIRMEGIKVYYGMNTFEFLDIGTLRHRVSRFFSALGPRQLRLCKSISLFGEKPNTCKCWIVPCKTVVRLVLDFSSPDVRVEFAGDCKHGQTACAILLKGRSRPAASKRYLFGRP